MYRIDKVAVTVWPPVMLKLEVLKEALPPLEGKRPRREFDPSWKLTMPVGGVSHPPVTIAVNETDCPGVEGLGPRGERRHVVANA